MEDERSSKLALLVAVAIMAVVFALYWVLPHQGNAVIYEQTFRQLIAGEEVPLWQFEGLSDSDYIAAKTIAIELGYDWTEIQSSFSSDNMVIHMKEIPSTTTLATAMTTAEKPKK